MITKKEKLPITARDSYLAASAVKARIGYSAAKAENWAPLAQPKPTAIYAAFDEVDTFKLVQIAREGISIGEFQYLKEHSPLSDFNWSQFLDISLKTLKRYYRNESHRFGALHSEKILQISQIVYKGEDVFGGLERLGLWLNTPSLMLDGERPIVMLNSSYGQRLVMTELVHIDQGILC
jgi:putative toxin-antitoxin system antitoxin component (TIGR02293 family)